MAGFKNDPISPEISHFSLSNIATDRFWHNQRWQIYQAGGMLKLLTQFLDKKASFSPLCLENYLASYPEKKENENGMATYASSFLKLSKRLK